MMVWRTNFALTNCLLTNSDRMSLAAPFGDRRGVNLGGCHGNPKSVA